MDTNYEAIRSLIELLVKKAGFDIDKDYSENELIKTREAINKFENDSNLSSDNKKKLISNLKLRQSNWENNAEVIGKALLECYQEGKSYNEVRGKIEFLATLAKKDDEDRGDNSLVGYVYDKIKTLESNSKEIEKTIEENNYSDTEEKEVDLKLKEYLTNRIDAYTDEIKGIDAELERLEDVKQKEEVISEKLKGYIANVKKDITSLEALKKSSLDKGITVEVWEKIETIELSIKDKLERTSSVMKRTDKMLAEVKSRKEELSTKKSAFEQDIKKSKIKLNEVTDRLDNDEYLDFTRKIEDINKKELINLELEEFKNKKEVIYIDVDKVKEELAREWQKLGNVTKKIEVKTKPVVREVIKEPDKEEVKPKATVKESKKDLELTMHDETREVLEEIEAKTKNEAEEVNEAVEPSLEKTQDVLAEIDKISKKVEEDKEILEEIEPKEILENKKEEKVEKPKPNKIELDW